MGFLHQVLPEIEAYVEGPSYLEGLPDHPDRTPLSLRKAILERTRPMAGIIEFKRISPGHSTSPLPLRSIPEFAGLTERAGATGLSCLACAPAFAGSPQDVLALTRASRLPVLFKDLVVGPRQVEAAHRAGAAAILLIARFELEGRLRKPLRDLAQLARSLQLEVLLELHDPEEVELVDGVPADVYGVNTRDLDTLKFEPDLAAETLRLMARHHPLLGLSGIQGREDVERFRALGTDGFLVGTSVARATDPNAFLTDLLGPVREINR
jgi:indole-3-glycerol phosphate synthase